MSEVQPAPDEPGTNLTTQPIDDPGPGGGGTGGGGGGSTGGGYGTSLFSFGFNKHEDSSILKVLAYASLSSPDDLQFTAYVMVDGNIYQVSQVNIVLDQQQSKGAMPITLPAAISGLGAGIHTITFSIANHEPDGALTVLQGSFIEVTELKQAAR